MHGGWAGATRTDADAVADALRAQPLVARRFAVGGGRLPFSAAPGVTLAELVNSLDRTAMQLVLLIKLRRRLDEDRARAEVRDLPFEQLELAARRLVLSGLAVVHDGCLRLTDALDEVLQLDQPLLADCGDLATSDALGRACKLLGLDAGTRKADRQTVLLQVLGDRDALHDALLALPPACTEIFQRVVDATLAGAGSGDPPAGSVAVWDALPDHLARTGWLHGPRSERPLDLLCDRQLLGSAWSRTRVWAWAESVAAVRDGLFPTWRVPDPPRPRPLPGAPAPAAGVLHALGDLVEHVAVNPPTGKRSGDREPPVKYWRSAAKAIDASGELVVLLGDVAIELGLLVPDLIPGKGRGRAVVDECRWRPEPARVADFAARPAAERYALVVWAWADPEVHPDLATAHRRQVLLALLQRLPDGHGVGAAELPGWAHDEHHLLFPPVVDQVLAELVALGLVETAADGTVGLSAAGRAVCGDLDALAPVLGGDADHFVVQPDHSIIAPPDLNAAVAERLRRIAELESSGGAQVWRLAAGRIAREAARTHVADVVAFLHTHSSVSVPSAVERFVGDCARAATPLRVQSVGCVITADDPAALADAARIRPAKLTVIAPGVAMSPLSEAKVVEILLGKGVLLAQAPAPSDAASTATPGPARGRAAARQTVRLAPQWIAPHRAPDAPTEPVGPVLPACTAASIDRVAARLAADGPHRRTRP